jgi:hypothetical protein
MMSKYGFTTTVRRLTNGYRQDIASQVTRGIVGRQLGATTSSSFDYNATNINHEQDHNYHRQYQRRHFYNRNSTTFATDYLHVLSPLSLPRREADYHELQQLQQRRSYHTTRPTERAAALILGLASVSALAYAGSSAIQSYNEWKAAQPTPEELEAMRAEEEKMHHQEEATRKEQEEQQQTQKKNTTEEDRPRENIFRQWFDVGSKYYEGGFEDQMTKREAALILGVRESSSASRIKEAHRKLLILNHPDTGGSTYIAGKINEAKELLLKGKQKA